MDTEKQWSYADLAELTHATQVENFEWCQCEEQEYFPYEDCPRDPNYEFRLREKD